MRIVFFGTSAFSAAILEHLIAHGQDVAGIVTRTDKPKGRSSTPQPSSVKAFALKHCPHIPLYQPEKASTEEFANVLRELQPDVFVVVAYGEIIKTNLLSIPRKMPINIHASLLPKYRGAAPIQRAIMNGEKETGITCIEMVLQMDAGNMLKKIKVDISEDMNFGELEEKLCKIAKEGILEVLKEVEKNLIVKEPQDPSQATFAPKITNEDRVIKWERSAEEVHNQIRGLSPYPGAYCFVELDGKIVRMGIKKSKKILEKSGVPGHTIEHSKEKWIVACGKGALSLLEVQMEGKKSLSIGEFLRGIGSVPLINLNIQS